MRVYLHIGLHKTGTTAVQIALRNNPALLARHGVVYPSSGRPEDNGLSLGHHLLPWTLSRPELVSGDPWSELRQELSRASESVAILSSEEFDVLHSSEQFERLREELREGDVKVVAYLRRQDEFLHAMYCTNVLNYRESRPFDVFKRSLRTELDYRVLLSRWEEWFGREGLIVRAYEPKRLIGGNMVKDFLDCVGLSGLALPASGSEPPLVNQSFPRNVIQLVIALREAGAYERQVREVVNLASIVYQGRTASDIMSPHERRAVIEEHEDSNAYVARTYLDRADGRLFEDTDLGDEAEWRARYEAPSADLVATLSDARRCLLDLAASPGFVAKLGDAHRTLLDLTARRG